jgi:NADH dehydrogenase
MKKIKILITGGTGFIGKKLFFSMGDEYNCISISRKFTGNSKVLVGDLKNYSSVKNYFHDIDVVIHLAYSKNYPENIVITKNLIKLSKENKIKKIILLSSMSAKRNFPDNYGKNKLHIEKIVKNSGIDYTILRPSIIYGKGSTSFDFIINYIKKIPFFTPIIGDGKYGIKPVHIEDITNAIKKCIANKKTNNKGYDLPGGEEIYFLDLINVLKKEINVRKPNLYLPKGICKIISFILPGIISKENIKNLTEKSFANAEDAHEDFDYKPIKFIDGIKNGLI